MSVNTYDEVPYPSSSFPQSHPLKVSTIARLFGMKPTPPDRAHVLELGAADGANLIPLAEMYPDARFTGIDLSAVQVEHGQKTIRELKLTNITLEQQDILDFDPKGAKYDYIIVHGIYSWVPQPVRDRILKICEDCLADQGVAYVSYNVLPGWHMRGMIRDMMLYHTDQFTDVRQQIGQSRALVKFLSDSVPTEQNPYGQFLRDELGAMQNFQDGYLRHDFLEEENRAFYFHEFMAEAGRHNLQYLGETELSAMLATNFPPQIQQTLAKVARNIVAMEQYMDFLRNRMFRMTLLVKKDLRLVRSISADVVKEFWIRPLLTPQRELLNFLPGEKEEFRHVNGSVVGTDSALVKVVLAALHRARPAAVPFSTVLAAVRRHFNEGRPAVREAGHDEHEEGVLAEQLVSLSGKNLVELTAFAPPTVGAATMERPKVSALARYQALNDPRHVTNLRHVSIRIDTFPRQLIALLDGTRTRDDLAAALADRTLAGMFSVQENGQVVTDRVRLQEILKQRVDEILVQLAGLGYLRAD